MTILVSGATGAVGRALVDALVERGAPVRAMSRRPAAAAELPAGVDVVAGDMGDASLLSDSLFDGVQSAFVFPADGGVDPFVNAAVRAGVRRFVVLSSLAVAAEFPRDVGSVSFVHHLAVEQAVTSRTDEWTLLRPGTFSNNLLAWASAVKAGVPIRAPYLHSAQAPIHEADIADVAALALTETGHVGRIHDITGPQALTKVEQVAAVAAGIGRELTVTEISAEDFRGQMSAYMPEPVVTMLLDYWSDTVATPDRVRDVKHLTGRPGRTLEQWATDHRSAFIA